MVAHVFVAIGDTHLQRTNPRNPDRLRALDQIIDESLALPDLAAFLWPGDLFHARSTPQDRLDIAERVLRMAARAPVVIAKGNHDQDGDLEIFALLKAAWPVYVITSPTTLRLRLATGAFASSFILPFPSIASLVAAGVPSPDLFQAAHAALEDIVEMAAAQLADARAAGDVTLMMGHCAIGGAKLSNAQPVIGREIELDAALLQKFGAVPKLLAHIHEPQEIHGAHFIGSITAQDFGEITPRRYLRVHMTADTWRPWTLESCPLDTPRLYHVEGILTRDEFVWRVTAGPGGEAQDAPASWVGSEVRVRYRMKKSERGAVNEKLVTDTFVGARRLQLDPIIESDRDLRAPTVAAARTLADKLSALLETGGQSMTEALRDKLGALEHQPATMVLTAVHELVARLEQIEPVSTQAAPTDFQEALL